MIFDILLFSFVEFSSGHQHPVCDRDLYSFLLAQEPENRPLWYMNPGVNIIGIGNSSIVESLNF